MTFLALLTLGLATASPADDALTRGLEAQKRGDTKSAITAYEVCLAQNPESVECHWEIGRSYWIENRWEKVVWHWTEVRSLDPDHPEVDRFLPRAKNYLVLPRA